MKIGYYNANAPGAHSASNEDGVLYFTSCGPTIVQPSEIMKVPTGISLQVEPGYILTISTAPELSQKAAELFPSTIVLDHTSPDTPLELAVRNNGRNPLNLMPAQLLARGYGSKVEKLEPEDFQPESPAEKKAAKTKPAKRNRGIQFEVKG